MKKIVHIFNGSNNNYTVNRMVNYLSKNFPNNNEFIILISDDIIISNINNLKNIKYIKVKNPYNLQTIFKIIKNTKKNDVIITHSIIFSNIQQLVILLQPKLNKKIAWLSWGGDLYEWKKNIYKENSIKIKIFNTIKNFISYYYRKNKLNFITGFEPDIRYYKDNFNSKAKTHVISYIDEKNPLYKNKIKSNPSKSINILVGHQSNPCLNHIEVLENLLRFQKEKIRIFIPLSYGDKKNSEKIREFILQNYKRNVICLLKPIPYKNYINFLQYIDIGIFHTYRQIGLGNIYPLLYMNKKIFLPSNSMMYDYFKLQGIKIFDSKILNSIKFEEFVNNDFQNKNIIENLVSIENKKYLWNELFNNL